MRLPKKLTSQSAWALTVMYYESLADFSLTNKWWESTLCQKPNFQTGGNVVELKEFLM